MAVSDWDISAGTYGTLKADQYVSAPTSFWIKGTGSLYASQHVLCKYPGTALVKDGEFRTWKYLNSDDWPVFLEFRNQSPVGTAVFTDTYFWMLFHNIAYLRVRVDDYEGTLYSCAISLSANTWERWRCTWDEGAHGCAGGELACRLFKEIGGVWVQQGVTFCHDGNFWSGSDVNRCGFGVSQRLNSDIWFDDSEVWGQL